MTRWLDDEEQCAWRSFIWTVRRLPELLNQELQARHGLTITDYEILVQLSEAPGRRLRMSGLADSALLSRSRLSHQITRMQRAGLVAREECPSDRRGAFAVLTDKGWDAVVEAAPTHVESVRRLVMDPLPREDFLRLGALMRTMYDGFEAHAGPSAPCEEASNPCDHSE